MLNFDNALFLHTGGTPITKDDLGYIPVPPSTDTFCPVPHHILLQEMHQAFTEHNLKVLQEQFAISKQGQRMFGVIELASDTTDYATLVAVRNSHDHSESIKLGLGTGVFVCDNMAFSAEFQLSRRHTSRVLSDLPNKVRALVATANTARQQQDAQINLYKQTELSPRDAHHLIVLLAKNRAFPASRALDVCREYDAPKHEEFAPRTVWSLMNATTEVLKGTSLLVMPERTSRMHSTFDHFCPPRPTAIGETADLFMSIDAEDGFVDFNDLMGLPAQRLPEHAD